MSEVTTVAKPCVSVIIPCRNEQDFVDGCLSSVFAFDPIQGGYEVLVIDGMSNDRTREKLEVWKTLHAGLRVLDNPARIVPTAMNIGIRESKGQYIVRLDAHSEYPTDYLRLCIETIEKQGVANVGGICVTPARDDSMQSRLVQAITTHRFGVGNASFRVSAIEGYADTVPYGCYRRSVFNEIGLFDERLIRNQDYELNRRIVMGGGQIWLNPDIRIVYFNQASLLGLFRQGFKTGYWNPLMWFIAPYSFAYRHLIPAVFVIGLLLTGITSLFTIIGSILLAAIVIPYLIISIIASWQQSRRRALRMLPILPVLFFSYHISYGVGILRGILLLFAGKSSVQQTREPWPGAGRYRAWPKPNPSQDP